jgi:hypothetical protein
MQIQLTDTIWQRMEGGYHRILYDASIPLRQLEKTNDLDTIDKLLDELWDELHHQGNVGLASYLSLPQLVQIARIKGIFTWRLLGLCSIIERQRHEEMNPELPVEFQSYYEQGLENLVKFISDNLNQNVESETFAVALSTLAVCHKQFKLGKAIEELADDTVLDEFLEQF